MSSTADVLCSIDSNSEQTRLGYNPLASLAASRIAA